MVDQTNALVIQPWCESVMKTKSKNPSILGQEFFYGISKRSNYRRAFPYLLDAAALGYIHAQNLVGYSYSLGLGVTRSKKAAAFWYEQAAKAGHREALTNLGLFYERGEGVRRNSKKAFALYKRAAELGDLVGQRKV